MRRLLVLVVLGALYLRVRVRKNPHLSRRVYPWFLATSAAFLLLTTNVGTAPDGRWAAVNAARVLTALALVGFLVFDVRRTLAASRR